MQKRKVKVNIVLPMEFPDEWDDAFINYHLNYSSWCWSNIIPLLQQYDKEHGCLCGICDGELFEETPKEDEHE